MNDQPEAANLLDVMANPHPRMWNEAVQLHQAQRGWRQIFFWRHIRWNGFLQAMCAATGFDAAQLIEKL